MKTQHIDTLEINPTTDVSTTKGHYIGKIDDRKDLYDKIFVPPKKIQSVTKISDNGFDINIPTSISGNIIDNIPSVSFGDKKVSPL